MIHSRTPKFDISGWEFVSARIVGCVPSFLFSIIQQPKMDQSKVEYVSTYNTILRRFHRSQNVEPKRSESLFGVCDLDFLEMLLRVKRFGIGAWSRRNELDIENDNIRNPVSLTKAHAI